jgi:hypothetical protein
LSNRINVVIVAHSNLQGSILGECQRLLQRCGFECFGLVIPPLECEADEAVAATAPAGEKEFV